MSAAADSLALLNFGAKRRLPMVRQTEAAECGLACLAMIAGYHGFRTDMAHLRRRFAVSPKGMSLPSLLAAAESLNLFCRPLKAELEALAKLSLPAILHWDMNHFVVLKQVGTKGIVIHDPAHGERRMSMNECSKHFTGVAIEMQPAQGFARADERERLRLSQLWSRLVGFKRVALQLLGLSAVLQLFVLVSPFYLQIVVDEVLTKFDTDLLIVLAVGFGLFTLIYVAANALRARLILFAGNMMSFQMMVNVFHHLLRLPQDYFDKRHIGDIDSRFGSTVPIKKMLTEGLIGGAIDGVMAATTMILMLVYAPPLAVIVLAAFLINVALRLGLYRLFRQRTEESILAQAEEHSNFIETVRGVMSIKLFGKENERERFWQNRLAEMVNADVRVGKIKIVFDVASKLLLGLETIIVVYLAARMVLAGQFTIGMLFAFMAYKTLFSEKALALVELLLEFRVLDLHLERLADIALTAPETVGEARAPAPPVEGRLTLRDIAFRYGDFEPYVLDGLNLTVKAGESVAITGPSGCGKTTLVKIMLGLLTPQKGDVLIDDRPLDAIGLRHVRTQVAAVMQDDRLFAGSLADNIAFFDPELDMARVMDCARLAAVHDEIMAMPMGYETLVGDMGTVLSGGQQQRVMLARALYHRPRMLFLDEGTAHLDAATEQRVNRAIAGLGITRVIIAHRAETVRSAERAYLFKDGALREVDPRGAEVQDIGKTPLSLA
ncbi:MAG: peptidase domain-containing ABC transporter [Alphaproteobacteria bacterium]|nr:MAG: peptidase domain-containing ABC transporter [Alphaproteobacteria bacterium]